MARSSIANAIIAWENAVTNAKQNGMDIPGMEGYLAPLEKALADAKELTARLEMRKGVKQQETKDRRALIQEGNFQVSRVRSAIKAFFGPNSERVIEFGARPLRPRSKKVKQPEAEPPPAPETPQPEAQGGSPAPKDEAPRNPTAA